MGCITGIGKNTLRSILVEASWTLISKDQAMREKYDRIKSIRAGSLLLWPLLAICCYA
jgi:hypothetical protein